MPRRAAAFTDADLNRMIRVMQARGLTVGRVTLGPGGLSVETVDAEALSGQDETAKFFEEFNRQNESPEQR